MERAQGIEAPGGTREPLRHGAPGIGEGSQPGVASDTTFVVAIHPPHQVPGTLPARTRITVATAGEHLPPELWLGILAYLDVESLRVLDHVSRDMRYWARDAMPQRRFELELDSARSVAQLSVLLRGPMPYAYRALEPAVQRQRLPDVVRVALDAPPPHRRAMLAAAMQALAQAGTVVGPRELVVHAALRSNNPAQVRALLAAGAAQLQALGVEGLLPPSSGRLLREFSVRNHEARAWPSPRELLTRDRLYDDTGHAVQFAWWLARTGREPLPQLLQMAPDERLPMLQAYRADHGGAAPDEMEALLLRVARGTRPLERADEVRAVLAAAAAQATVWPTWVEDRRQLLHVLGGHVAAMPAAEHARAMAVLREANDALPAAGRIDLSAYDR